MPAPVLALVVVVGATHLAAHYTGRRALAGVLKALPILALAALSATTQEPVSGRYAQLVTAGLLWSAVGDVCLVWPERFTLGLASFLIAHGCYLVAFGGGPAAGAAWGWLAGIVVVAVGLLRVLWPHLGRVRGPVLVYVAVIAAMAWAAARRAAGVATPSPSGELALAGAVSFMASDGVLAIDRFAHRFPAAHGVVMVTYYAAQTLIAASVPVSP